jgi:hypothetical protein
MFELFAVSGRVIDEIWAFLERHAEALLETLAEFAHASKLCGGPHHDLQQCQDMIERWAPWSLVVLGVVGVVIYVSRLPSK